MGIFSDSINSNNTSADTNIDKLVENFLINDLSRMTSAQIQEFCAPGGMGEMLVEAKKMSKKTLVRLSKADDLERRVTLSAMQLAKENNDSLFDKLAKVRIKEKELLAKIKAKYANKAQRNAMIAQKEYIKVAKNMPSSFMKSGGSERL